MNQKSSLRDPLDELRSEEWPKLCSFSEWRNRLADAWQAERDEHEKSLSYATSRWKNACDNVEATAASQLMFVPLDADGVPCRIGDEMEFNKTRFSVVGYRQCDADGSLLIFGKGLNAMCSESCHHVAPKPETIEDVRKSKDDLVAFLAQSGVMGWKDLNSFAVDFSAVLERAYECGMRDSCARGGYADPSVLGGDAS